MFLEDKKKVDRKMEKRRWKEGRKQKEFTGNIFGSIKYFSLLQVLFVKSSVLGSSNIKLLIFFLRTLFF